MKHLILIRGLPGSGKSTLAKKILAKNNITSFNFEADQYFYRDSVYTFDSSDLKRAHETCKYNASLMLRSYTDVNVIVSNTFVTLKEMTDYLNMEYDKLTIIEMATQYGSIHNVPNETIERMKRKFVSEESIKKYLGGDVELVYTKVLPKEKHFSKFKTFFVSKAKYQSYNVGDLALSGIDQNKRPYYHRVTNKFNTSPNSYRIQIDNTCKIYKDIHDLIHDSVSESVD